MNTWITIPELARRRGVSTQRIRELMFAGRLEVRRATGRDRRGHGKGKLTYMVRDEVGPSNWENPVVYDEEGFEL